MKKITLILSLVMAAFASNAAVSESASIIFPVLDMGAGARADSMGGAFTAVADDSSAVYWNAAGLGNLKNMEIALTYNKWFMDTMFSEIFFAFPLSAGTIGAEVVYVNLGSMPQRDIYGAATGNVYPYIAGGSLGYGLNFGALSAGAAIKVIGQSTGTMSNAAFAADLGALFKAGMYSAGLTIQNAGSGDGYNLPLNVRAGAAIRPLDSREHKLLLAVESQFLFMAGSYLSAGAEYVYMNMLAVRAGYKAGLGATDLEGLTGISAGLGVKIAGLNIDYAIVPYGDLGLTHRATLSYVFGEKAGDRQDEKQGKTENKKTGR